MKRFAIKIGVLILLTSKVSFGQEMVTEINRITKNHIDSYKWNPRLKIVGFGGGWAKEIFTPDSIYQLRLEKFHPPFEQKATLEFILRCDVTEFHKLKSEAEIDTNFIQNNFSKHNHEYLLYNGKWIVAKRESKDSSEFTSYWFDCNEIVELDGNKNENINGCWEENIEMKFGFLQAEEDLEYIFYSELNDKNYEKVIELATTYSLKYPNLENLYKLYYWRAISKIELKNFHGAIYDCDTAYLKNNNFVESILLRGYAKQHLGDMSNALIDYNAVLSKQPNISRAYQYKGELLNEIGQLNDACDCFEKALQLGITDAYTFLMKFCDNNSEVIKKFTYRLLVDKSDDMTYGFNIENPIKVGWGPQGQTSYLNLLRDGKGKKIEYKRLGSSVPVDIYEVLYKTKNGETKTSTLYLSFYSYEQPKIPIGFYSVDDFQMGKKKKINAR